MTKRNFPHVQLLPVLLLLSGAFWATGCSSTPSCKPGTANCSCASNACSTGLGCVANRCLPVDALAADATSPIGEDATPDSASGSEPDTAADDASTAADDGSLAAGSGGAGGRSTVPATGGVDGGAAAGGSGGAGTAVGVDAGSASDAPLVSDTLGGGGGAGGAAGAGGATGTGGTGGHGIDGGGPGGIDGASTLANCGPLASPLNGSVYAPETTAGSMASYSCSSGYTLSGTSARICQATGVWTGTAPTCVGAGVSCPSLPSPAGGIVSASLRNPGAVATYTCSAGYTMVGAATRTCQTDGTWSGTAPTCAGIDCGPPGVPVNGSVSAPTTTYPATATFSCLPGFSLSGLASIACLSSGTWSGAVPTCACGKTMCNGTCIDTSADVNHCGGCNTVCATPTAPSTVACVGGRCLTTLTSTDDVLGLTVDASNVYWSTTSGKIMSVPVAGGAATTLATGQNEPEDIAVGTDGVYWVNYFGATVMKIPLPVGPAVTLATGQGYPSAIVVDANFVYWANGSIMKASHNGGTVTPVVTGTGINAWSLALNATNVFWTGASTVGTAPIGGGAANILSSGMSGARSVAIDATNAYSANTGTSANSYTDGTVTKVPLGGGATTVLASAQASPYAIAADGASVFWANAAAVSAGGGIMKVGVDGTNLTTLISGRFYPQVIAVDATSVYWSDGGKTGSGFVVVKLTPK